MKCPHCTVTIHAEIADLDVGNARDKTGSFNHWRLAHSNCPNCAQKIIWLAESQVHSYAPGLTSVGAEKMRSMVWPRSSERPVSSHVPADIAGDFSEACCILPISPQASAALTRRCLQQILRESGQTKSKDLYDQIEEVITNNHLPESLAEQLNAVRIIGNFAAHPLKSLNTGQILPVETHEAEWNLDVLEAVFDHYFVKPALAKARKDALNKKLAEAGKPLLP